MRAGFLFAHTIAVTFWFSTFCFSRDMWQGGVPRRLFPYGTLMGTLWDPYGTFTPFFAFYFSTKERTILRRHAICNFCKTVHGEGITNRPSTCSLRENTRRHERNRQNNTLGCRAASRARKKPKSLGESMAQG